MTVASERLAWLGLGAAAAGFMRAGRGGAQSLIPALSMSGACRSGNSSLGGVRSSRVVSVLFGPALMTVVRSVAWTIVQAVI